jgi:hypothetical protein
LSNRKEKKMVNIRRGTFETNSSSTHSICVCKEDRGIEFPDIDLNDFKFGWEHEKYCSSDEKLAYIIFGILTETYNEGFATGIVKIKKLLDTVGKWVKTVHIRDLELVTYEGKTYLESEDGYVDHASEMKDFTDALLADEELLKRYLFSTDSFILTGNDNEDDSIDINVDYDYDEFYKGN